MKTLRALAIVTAAAASSLPAIAELTTVGFTEYQSPGFTEGMLTTNLQVNEYWFSPECHVDVSLDRANLPAFADGVGIGWDAAGCDAIHNEEFRGAGSPGNRSGKLYIDHGGEAFNLVSLVAISNDLDGSASFMSSKGGNVTIDLGSFGVTNYSFLGDDWQGITWVVAYNGGGGPNYYLDSITMYIPEPLTLSLVGIAAAGAAAARRRTAR